MSMEDFVNTLNDEQKAALLAALSKEETVKTNSEKVEVDREDFTVIKNTSAKNKREKVKAKQNTWVDTGEDRHIVTPEKPLTPRTRKPPAKKNVQCSVCGKKYSINASLVYGEYYRCDNCIG